GTYSGQLKLSAVNKSLPVTFYLFLGEVQEAPLPGDLRPGIRVVLRGRMIQASTMGDSDNLILTGQFDGVTGALRLDPDPAMSTTASGCRLGGQDPISVTGHVNGENLTATVLRNGQNWGVINVRRVSRDSTTGATLSEE